jgi:hypothetical protein
MHRARRQRVSTLLSPFVVLALVAAVIAAFTTTAGASPSSSSAAAAVKRSVRQIPRGLTLSFPTNQRVGNVPGVQNPEIKPGEPEEGGDEGDARAAARAATAGGRHLTKAGNRSMSVRPTSRTAPLLAQEAGLTIPNVKGMKVQGTPGLRRSFEGLNHFDQRTANNGNQFSIVPPDQGLCVGNGFVFETLNDVLQVYDTSGRALSPPTDLNSFYGYPPIIDRVNGIFGPEPTDPSCLFDAATNRWFHVVLTLEVDPEDGALTGANHLDLAVSKTGNPLDGFNIYQLPVQDDGTQGTPSHVGCPCIGDYPHMGADKFGFYLTTNEYPLTDSGGVFGNGYNGSQIYAFSKAALAAGAASVNVTQFESPTLNDGTPSFTVWPAQSNPAEFVTRQNGTEYFLQSTAAEETLNEEGMSNRLGFWKLTNTRSLDSASPAPDLTSVIIGSETYGVPPRSEQKGGSVPLRDCLITPSCATQVLGAPDPFPEVEGPLDSNDTRMQQTWFAGGKLYGALDTIARVNGDLKAATAWFAVDPRTPRVVNQGYVAVANNNVNYPAIGVLKGSGKGVMAFTLVGGNHFPSAAYVTLSGGKVTGDVHVAGKGKGPDDSFCDYVAFNCAGTDPPSIRPRWGDYGAAVPVGDSVWIASEWTGQTCTFARYLNDMTCGQTRTALANWSTRISLVRP